VAPAALPGLEPSGWDFRWTGAWVEERPPDADAHGVITRSRIALDSAGEPVLLDLASECWEVTSGCVHAGRLFRFDRAEWLRGGDPWRPVPEAAVVGVRDPRDPSRVLTGSHGAIARGFPVLALGGEARAERTVQLEAARRVLRTVRAAPATPPPARAP
jgi:hypothetical protein